MRRFTFLLLMSTILSLPMMAQDEGTENCLWMSAELQKKINKQWSIGTEVEYRLRDDMKNTDRWTASVSAAYKPYKWLKFDAGYKFIRLQNPFEQKLAANGQTVKRETPAYWSNRHRLFASVTGTLSLGQFDISLRERWQYTYRPEITVESYDGLMEDGDRDDKVKEGKASHVLRSRLEVGYNIPRSNINPYVNVELYHAAGGLDKIRYTAGADWKITKQHTLGAFLRYVDDKGDDPDYRVIGLSYKYKF